MSFPKRINELFASLQEYIVGNSVDDLEKDLYQLGPPPVDEKGVDWERRGHYYRRGLAITALPPVIESPWLSRIAYKFPMSKVISNTYIDPIDDFSIQQDQMRRLSHLQSRRCQQSSRGLRERFECNPRIESTRRLLERTLKEQYFKLGIYFELRDSSREGLEAITDYMYSIAEEEDFSLVTLRHHHLDSFRTASPTNVDELEYHTIVSAETIAAVTLPVEWSPMTLHNLPSE